MVFALSLESVAALLGIEDQDVEKVNNYILLKSVIIVGDLPGVMLYNTELHAYNIICTVTKAL